MYCLFLVSASIYSQCCSTRWWPSLKSEVKPWRNWLWTGRILWRKRQLANTDTRCCIRFSGSWSCFAVDYNIPVVVITYVRIPTEYKYGCKNRMHMFHSLVHLRIIFTTVPFRPGVQSLVTSDLEQDPWLLAMRPRENRHEADRAKSSQIMALYVPQSRFKKCRFPRLEIEPNVGSSRHIINHNINRYYIVCGQGLLRAHPGN